MAARAALGSMCRRLWQGSRSFSVNGSKSSTARNGGFLLTSMKWVQFSNLHVDIPKDLTKPTITISDEPDTLYKRLSVLVKGHDKAVLDSYEYFAVLAAKELGISIKVHEPPRKIERFTLLKSVHIFKKHRVQYEMRTLYRCLELEHLTGSTADVYLEYIQRNLPEGVAMEVIKQWQLSGIPPPQPLPPPRAASGVFLPLSSCLDAGSTLIGGVPGDHRGSDRPFVRVFCIPSGFLLFQNPTKR
ncbi:28S ribosomal protein S10, mitochondrial isoform X2 [Panthera uncia]|uniref:28S ribosomal protein S10, mitochondrial isoform X2 n=1 Tax=Panthera uncia TaxID=29064 RepID=UPI0020FFC09E|nr:28S ribosomal protein S10, mitochondrial isoform X2 [Panthera uncia]